MDEQNQVIVEFNGENYVMNYNNQTDYFELEIKAPDVGGIYDTVIRFTDLYNTTYRETVPVQVWAKEPIVIETNKVFMWIFNFYDFSVKDIVEIANYEINIDEETNANTIINVLKKTTAKARDIVAIKRNNEVIYWGTIDNIQNTDGQNLYEYTIKYITNLFEQDIVLQNENLIKTTGVEDFIADAITNNFINNEDTFVNINYFN